MTTHTGQTFDSPIWQMFAGDTFESCVFQGTAVHCNFCEAIFTDCTFDPGFVFESCNILGAQGLPAEFEAPQIPEADEPLRDTNPALWRALKDRSGE